LVPEKFVDVQGTHATTIRQVSAASVILLKNEQKTLPLQNIKRLGIIGDDAGSNAGYVYLLLESHEILSKLPS
jgi:beta-glucosidase